jgi:hypothetical protein
MASAMEEALAERHDHDQLTTRAKNFSIRNISDQYLAYYVPSENKNN